MMCGFLTYTIAPCMKIFNANYIFKMMCGFWIYSIARIYLKFSSNSYPAKQHWLLILSCQYCLILHLEDFHLLSMYVLIHITFCNISWPTSLESYNYVLYNFKIKHFLFPQLIILCYLFMITYFFSILTAFTRAISFNFTSFSSSDS